MRYLTLFYTGKVLLILTGIRGPRPVGNKKRAHMRLNATIVWTIAFLPPVIIVTSVVVVLCDYARRRHPQVVAP